ncbi:MAG: (2Fe-2S)-binding protein [Deltaproteobacteria bacterium]|nr:(2Fe-2S)-binding protein [Deltaproteobacteria bacterium]
MNKTIVCRCEDVMLAELHEAIEAGHLDIESLKRFTGFGTGVCQGKSCIAHVARVLSESGQVSIQPFTARPPVVPIPLALLAGKDAE